MVNRQIQYTAKQREDRLICFLENAKGDGISPQVIKKYKSQLKEVQAEVKRDKDKAKQFNANRIEKGVRK